MTPEKKYLLFYLKTGGGHLAPAKSVAKYINAKYRGKIKAELIDGFQETNSVLRYLVEDGYRILQADAKWYYEMLYAMNKFDLIAKLNCAIITLFTRRYIKKIIDYERPEKIVVFHFFMIEPVSKMLKELKLNIPVYTVVTDPYTAHPIWFLQKRQNFIVFSDRLKKSVELKRPESRINVFSFILDEKFSNQLPDEVIPGVKHKHGFPEDKKVILIMGGGDGIPHGKRIMEEILKSGIDASVAIVCGKNKKLFNNIANLKRRYSASNVFNFGYIDFVYELLNISDIVVTKCGASTMMEILIQQKIPIVNDFIWEQEKGNMEFIRDNQLGIYEPEIKKIPKRLEELLADDAKYNFYKNNIIKEDLKNGTEDVAEFLVRS